ncbi:iron sulfur assembly protein 1 [Gaeumannomyces tritici R3-111a-1]|uniref:Iron-sulfur assembly protein 1 n=1 Tax=Gaeumannomyces tritici (strain R3-111a-1) TaxID=644352 RepID=J3NLY1_GAET3|nr:iron sulfur assembly protein 1 [Gaeumannomyces tritici R3-111a-1]EJT82312.1 iron sulfur assembly protein 1 [Gaeumannomyces tritici R3-111a-1]
MKAGALLARRASAFVCLSCRSRQLQNNNSRRILLQGSRRHFSSTPSAAFQSYTLPSHEPSARPRNADVPETSITKPIEVPLPRVHDTRPPEGRDGSSPAIAPEAEAQTPAAAAAAPPSEAAPATSTTSATAPTATETTPANTQEPLPSAAKRPSRLRAPRKAAMRLTPAAVEQLRALLDGPDPKLIKVGVRNRGCSGLAYHLEYVDQPGAFDETVEQDGVRVLIDSKALFSIIGSEMDWIEDKLSQRFVFRNPNIKEECGCGESFMV